MKHSLKFSSFEELRCWFEANHTTSPGLWIRFENHENPVSPTPEDALKIAISFGWVDDRIKRISNLTYRKKFIPRRDGSPWTDAQKTLVAELTASGQLEKPGFEAAARARLDGSWDTSGDPSVTDAMLDTFTSALRPYDRAFSAYLRQSPATQRAYAVNYCGAKRAETRSRRLAAIVEKLNAEPTRTRS